MQAAMSRKCEQSDAQQVRGRDWGKGQWGSWGVHAQRSQTPAVELVKNLSRRFGFSAHQARSSACVSCPFVRAVNGQCPASSPAYLQWGIWERSCPAPFLHVCATQHRDSKAPRLSKPSPCVPTLACLIVAPRLVLAITGGLHHAISLLARSATAVAAVQSLYRPSTFSRPQL
jgi:hypothetical protein